MFLKTQTDISISPKGKYRNILLITNRFPTHADDLASPFVKEFYLELKQKGIKSTVFTPFYHSEKFEENPEVYRFNWAGGEKVVGNLSFSNPREIFQLFTFLKNGRRELLNLAEQKKPDFCLALWALPSGWFAYLAKTKFGIPYGVWCLGSDIYTWAERPILKNLIKKVLQNADFLFADGLDLRNKVENLVKRECHFLPSFRTLPNSEIKIGMDKSKTNFVYLGRWEKKKGIEELLKGFQLLVKNYEQARLYVLGWGEYEEKMKNFVQTHSLSEKIKLIGKVSTEELASYLKECDCVVIPSWSDSIPLVFSESLQAGKPVIGTQVGDLGYLIDKYNLGIAVPPRDYEKLALALEDFIKEKKDYSRGISSVLDFLQIKKSVSDFLKTVNGVQD